MGHTQTLKRVIKLLTFWFKPRRKPKLVINCEHTIKHTTWEWFQMRAPNVAWWLMSVIYYWYVGFVWDEYSKSKKGGVILNCLSKKERQMGREQKIAYDDKRTQYWRNI